MIKPIIINEINYFKKPIKIRKWITICEMTLEKLKLGGNTSEQITIYF